MTTPTTLPRGVFAAALTPLDPSLAPDHDAFIRHATSLLDNGCDGLAVLGSTGEANSLSLDRRLALIETAGARLPRDRLLIGTGACAVADAITLTRASLDAGVDNVLVLPPFYYRPVGDDGVFAYFARLIDAVGTDRLRVFLYNFPQLTGFTFSAGLIRRLHDRFGPVIAGMKDSSGDWESMRSLCAVVPDFALYAGTERYLLDILDLGGAGCITATANVTCGHCQSVFQAWQSGDRAEAERRQARLTEIRLSMQQLPLVPLQKAILQRRTEDDIWLRMLPPFAPLADEQEDAVSACLAALQT
jgi:4-hydroxy-tetrahydrodipicolinate synthase